MRQNFEQSGNVWGCRELLASVAQLLGCSWGQLQVTPLNTCHTWFPLVRLRLRLRLRLQFATVPALVLEATTPCRAPVCFSLPRPARQPNFHQAIRQHTLAVFRRFAFAHDPRPTAHLALSTLHLKRSNPNQQSFHSRSTALLVMAEALANTPFEYFTWRVGGARVVGPTLKRSGADERMDGREGGRSGGR